MPFVLDSSAALARVAPDETLAPDVRRLIETDSAVAPALWPFETVNGLETMRRRGAGVPAPHSAVSARRQCPA